jgi:heme oxygenase
MKPPAGPVHAALREATRAVHLQTHDLPPLRRVMDGNCSSAEYRALLARLWGFVAAVEDHVAGDDLPAALGAGRRGDLEADLAWLGLTEADIAALPRCPLTGIGTGMASRVAALYVLEGSRQGGRLLAAKLGEALGVDSRAGATYFSSSGRDVEPGWQDFLAFAECRAAGHEAEAAQAAIVTFQLLIDWLGGQP